MTQKPQLKPGDRVVVKPHEITRIDGITYYILFSRIGHTVTLRKLGGHPGYPLAWTFEEGSGYVLPEWVEQVPDLSKQLKAAEAEVYRLKKAIAERDKPKAGDIYRTEDGNITARVVNTEDDWVFYVVTNRAGDVYPLATDLKTFKRAYPHKESK